MTLQSPSASRRAQSEARKCIERIGAGAVAVGAACSDELRGYSEYEYIVLSEEWMQ